jgi:hypothetical protein
MFGIQLAIVLHPDSELTNLVDNCWRHLQQGTSLVNIEKR